VLDFAEQLRELRRQAGSPSFRALAKITHYSSSALAEATSGKRLPSEAVVRAFVAACGAHPDEWITLLHQAAADSTAARAAVPETAPATRPGRLHGRRGVLLLAAGACGLLAAGAVLGAALRPGQAPDSRRSPGSAVAAKSAARPARDGADPIAAGCVGDARLVDKSPVMLHGQQIGALEMIYSARCAAAWARIYLYPGRPSMLGQVTVQASDGRLSSFAYPLIKQVAVYTDVIRSPHDGCLGASTTFRSAHGTARASISCQDPASAVGG